MGMQTAPSQTTQSREQLAERSTQLPKAEPTSTPTAIPKPKITFISDESGHWEVYTMNEDGGERRRLTAKGIASAPVWSPDGEQIAFAWMSKDGEPQDIWVMLSDGSTSRNLTAGHGDSQYPTWSPDGRYIAFASNREGDWDIFIADSSSGNILRNLTATHPGDQISPDWSMDDRITYASNGSGQWKIWITDTDGRNRSQITGGSKTHEDQPAWSPDAKRIAFVFWNAVGQTERVSNIGILDLESESLTQITKSVDRLNADPAWTPDGTAIIYASSDAEGQWELYWQLISEGNPRKVTSYSTNDRCPAYTR